MFRMGHLPNSHDHGLLPIMIQVRSQVYQQIVVAIHEPSRDHADFQGLQVWKTAQGIEVRFGDVEAGLEAYDQRALLLLRGDGGENISMHTLLPATAGIADVDFQALQSVEITASGLYIPPSKIK